MSSQLDALRRAAEKLHSSQIERDEQIRKAAKTLSVRQIAAAVGLSHQRVHQIIHGTKKAPPSS